MQTCQINKGEYLPQFFFVTDTGDAYVARTQKIDGVISSFVLKIGCWKEDSYHPIKGGDLLPQGDYIAITSQFGVFFYNEHHPTVGRRERAENTNIAFWQEGTAPIVAMFSEEEEMIAALVARRDENQKLGKKLILIAFDPYWRESTLGVLTAIGDSHPCFVPSRMSELDPRVPLHATAE